MYFFFFFVVKELQLLSYISHIFKMSRHPPFKTVYSSNMQKSSQDCNLQTGSFLNWKEYSLRESWCFLSSWMELLLLHMFHNKIVTWAARICLTLPRLVIYLFWWQTKERSKDSGACKLWEVSPLVLSILNLFMLVFLRPNWKVYEFQLGFMQSVFLLVIAESWHEILMSNKLFHLEYLQKENIFSVQKN